MDEVYETIIVYSFIIPTHFALWVDVHFSTLHDLLKIVYSPLVGSTLGIYVP